LDVLLAESVVIFAGTDFSGAGLNTSLPETSVLLILLLLLTGASAVFLTSEGLELELPGA
jgi:hypothetical protein